jgi:hypothetical protein
MIEEDAVLVEMKKRNAMNLNMCLLVKEVSKTIVMLQQYSIRSGAKSHPAALHLYFHYEVVLVLKMILSVRVDKTNFHSEQKV